jgi:creatinine amidohydrolase/Fe(II)-dependent formamide hydrolase-like protein
MSSPGRVVLLGIFFFSVGARAETPDTVFFEELTWVECRDAIRAGKTTVLIPTGGTEQNGPHMVLGKHNFVLRYTMEKVARALGNALVAPILAYVPEGEIDPPTGHMRFAGTVSLPDDVFMEVLEQAARSLRASGFKDIVLLGDSGGNQNGMKEVAARLDTEWSGSGFRAHFIGDYYAKAHADQNRILSESYGETAESIGRHAGILDTSELLAIEPGYVRRDKIAPGGGYEGSGVNGDPTRASAARGELMLAIKINHAVHQIRESIAAKRGDK